MNTTTAKNQVVLDAIKNTVIDYITGFTTYSEEPDTIHLKHAIGYGSIIAGLIGDVMHEKYPEQDYTLSIKHGYNIVEVSLLES